MAKLTIELDVPDYIMKIAMSEKSKEGLRRMCQLVCQEEFDTINRNFMSTVLPLTEVLMKKIEKRILNGKMTLNEDAPQFLKDIFYKVKSEKSTMKDAIRVYADELKEWMIGQEKETSGKGNPFDSFEGLINKEE